MNRIYEPDGWVVLEITLAGKPSFYKILGSWSGGFASAGSWRLSSGADSYESITEISDGRLSWPQASGSVYEIKLSGEGRLNPVAHVMVKNVIEKVQGVRGSRCKVVKMSSIRS